MTDEPRTEIRTLTARDYIRAIQAELRQPADLTLDRAADLLMQATALIGNVADEIRVADAAYAARLLAELDCSEKANRAKIRAETSVEYQRARQAKDAEKLLIETVRSLKVFLRVKQDEWREGNR